MSEKLSLCFALLLCIAGAGLAAETPMAVSPGGGETVSVVAARCPTFSWGAVDRARSYELVVYRLEEPRGSGEPVLRHEVPAAALSWTPSIGSCLKPGGHYAWSVRGTTAKRTTAWSEPALFDVAPETAEAEFQRALAVVERYLADDRAGAAAGDVPEEAQLASLPLEREQHRRGPSSEVPSVLGPETGQLYVEGTVLAFTLREVCTEGARWWRNNHCYIPALASPGLGWAEAAADCALNDSYLVTLTSAEEETFVRNLWASQYPEETLNHLWIAYSDARGEGWWEWDTGELAVTGNNSTYTNWESGEPSDSFGGEDCAELVLGGWNDSDCAIELRQYVCEKDE